MRDGQAHTRSAGRAAGWLAAPGACRHSPALGSPDGAGAQHDAFGRGLAGFPLQSLLDELPQELGALTGLHPQSLLQPPQTRQVLALHPTVLGLEVGALREGGVAVVRAPGWARTRALNGFRRCSPSSSSHLPPPHPSPQPLI